MLGDNSLAYYDNAVVVKRSIAYKSCELVAIPVAYFPVQFAMAVQKESEFKDLFAFHINKMIETGMVKQIVSKYLPDTDTQHCPDYSGKPLGINQCFTAFLLLFAGLCISLVWFW